MAKEERERIIIPDENGDENLFEVLFKFDVDQTGKSYMVTIPVSDSEDDDTDEVEVFPFRYEEKGEADDDLALFPLETDEEWDMIEEMLNTFQDDEYETE
ncbi:DUF1292 domain-containing protein [Fictibacillus phosphorivorans]|uniref:DUF1292 domain-containing protein n=1 Tax=Fictibacillus phosphorivorans TaxID=1221500 RepID=UPI00203BDCAA|nr:DUF1292 domain-containing protein [Fictibacillus phosphorivorans]MCM3716959.1 DUF1292 domain-containing protein [Fictibacillus phosphorivorans]MCM3774492.1 DUF1292 domain-containing protein [Fictibacillus phosphorivorans]